MLLYLTEDQAKNILGNDNLTKVGIQIAQKNCSKYISPRLNKGKAIIAAQSTADLSIAIRLNHCHKRTEVQRTKTTTRRTCRKRRE